MLPPPRAPGRLPRARAHRQSLGHRAHASSFIPIKGLWPLVSENLLGEKEKPLASSREPSHMPPSSFLPFSPVQGRSLPHAPRPSPASHSSGTQIPHILQKCLCPGPALASCVALGKSLHSLHLFAQHLTPEMGVVWMQLCGRYTGVGKENTAEQTLQQPLCDELSIPLIGVHDNHCIQENTTGKSPLASTSLHTEFLNTSENPGFCICISTDSYHLTN